MKLNYLKGKLQGSRKRETETESDDFPDETYGKLSDSFHPFFLTRAGIMFC